MTEKVRDLRVGLRNTRLFVRSPSPYTGMGGLVMQQNTSRLAVATTGVLVSVTTGGMKREQLSDSFLTTRRRDLIHVGFTRLPILTLFSLCMCLYCQ
jgi:hypothetical protein